MPGAYIKAITAKVGDNWEDVPVTTSANVVFLNGRTGTYQLFQYALCACDDSVSGAVWNMVPLATSGGTGSKTANYSAKFPIGCSIYYHPGTTAYAANTNFSGKPFYTTYDEVDARYTAINPTGLNLHNSSTSEVFLHVSVDDGYWSPYYKSGAVNEIIVTSNSLASGNFYIYLGKTSGSTTYKFQLESNHPLYYYDGSQLIDWVTYNSSVSLKDTTSVSLKGTTNASAQETYSVYPYSLCAFSTYVYPQTYMIMTSLVLSSGLSNKTPYTAHWFPIGCKIYYYNGGTALNGAFSSQRFYTTYNGVDARYSAVTGDNLDLFSDVSGGPVYLRVEIRKNNFEWRPYHKQGETNEIIVSGAQVEVGGFYIYLGRSVVSSDYMFQLEDNNPLYACVMDGSGTHLVDWVTYNSSRTPYLVKNIQLFPSSLYPIGSNPIIGNTGIYSRQSYLDSSYLEGVYKVTLQLHAWWDYPTGTLDTPQPLSVIVKHNANDKIAGGTFVIPVIESPNDSNYEMGTLVVNLVGFVTFTSAQTINDYIEVKVQGVKGINLGGEHPLWGGNEGDVEYNDGLILERVDWYNPS